jgi:hypothetical protein
MGMYDEIRWDAPLPEGHSPEDRIFQTKSLDPCLEHYLVTPEGRLFLVGSGWQGEDLEHAENLQGVDVEFHGDIRIISVKFHREYLVRFTHGALEWIKPLAELEPYDAIAIARLKFAASRAEASPADAKPDIPKEPETR